MSTWLPGQEGDGAAEIDREAALDPAEDHALDAVAGLEFLLELVPCGFAARAVARQHRFARPNSRPGRHRPRPRRRPPIRPSGPAPRTRAARPGLRDFKPTSITAMSFSIAVTMPLTTLPSKVSFSPPRLSLSMASKSSRVGKVVVAMRVCSLSCLNRACRVAATMAGLHMRTWSNARPPEHHALAASVCIPSTEKSASRCRPSRSTVRARRRTGCRGREVKRPPDGGGISGGAAREQASAHESRHFPIDYREQIGNKERHWSRVVMLVLDPALLIALAALISSLAAVIWAVRRKP